MAGESHGRRGFIKKGALLGAAGYAALHGFPGLALANSPEKTVSELIAVRNGDPVAMYKKGLEILGGLQSVVRKGQTVLVKPNMAFRKEPEEAANTNPLLVKAIIESCYAAGAKKVYVFDNIATSVAGFEKEVHRTSGIAAAARSAGAEVVPAGNEKYYQEVRIPAAKILKKTKVHELVLSSDVFINVPILKHHSYTYMTAAMKNLMGVVWDRMVYHYEGLDQSISDFCLFRKPDLNVLDAYRVMVRNGPHSGTAADIATKKMLMISKDIVAIDSAAARILGTDLDDLDYINMGHAAGIGNKELTELKIKKFALG